MSNRIALAVSEYSSPAIASSMYLSLLTGAAVNSSVLIGLKTSYRVDEKL